MVSQHLWSLIIILTHDNGEVVKYQNFNFAMQCS